MELIDVECTYCGSLIELSKAVKLNIETGEYEYVCVNCAIKWDKKYPKHDQLSDEDKQKLEALTKSQ
jgi:DNA-directed RNA polymerase subunit RPC12/RpoP